MSKIGRKPIPVGAAKVQIQGNVIEISGSKGKFTHQMPKGFDIKLEAGTLCVNTSDHKREQKVLWGLYRALLANKIKGADTGFEKKLTIVGLGFKAQASGKKLVFTLGYTHKIDYTLPNDVTVDIDKTGQQLVVKSSDKFVLGNVCDAIRSFRPPEPYKGTGIIREGEVVRRKAGKTKAG